jgi:hypothetical protein
VTYETFGRLGILAIFDFESKILPKTFFIEIQPTTHCCVFDLRNEFHANRMSFGDFGEQIFFADRAIKDLKLLLKKHISYQLHRGFRLVYEL